MMKKPIFLILIIFLFKFLACGLASQEETSISKELSFSEKMKEKITLDYKDADLVAVLRSLSLSYGINIVASSEVKGKINVNLRDVAVEKALEAILAANGFTYIIKDDIIYIAPGDPEMVERVSEVIFLKYMAAGEAQNFIREVISSKGNIKMDEVSNSLVITDFPPYIRKVKELLSKIDLAPLQVLIEAKILDITSQDLKNLGITWTSDYKPDKDGLFGRSRASTTQEELKTTTTMAGPSSTLSGGQFKIDALTLTELSITATIDALIQKGKANLLASPSIAVINGQEARIVIGEKVPYKERTQTTTGTTETTKFIDVGTNLRVTPQVNEDGYITMRVHPEVSSVSSLLDAGPRITTREADTTVRVKEGETIIIGGLIKYSDEKTVNRVPILGYIPILDLFFKNTSTDKTQKELAVFISPKILRSREEKEKISKKQLDMEASYTAIEPAGEFSLCQELFEKAKSLERGKGLESEGKSDIARIKQAVSLYEQLINAFPDSPYVPEAMYNISKIYYKELNDNNKARDILSHLISDYPDNLFARKARKLYNEIP